MEAEEAVADRKGPPPGPWRKAWAWVGVDQLPASGCLPTKIESRLCTLKDRPQSQGKRTVVQILLVETGRGGCRPWSRQSSSQQPLTREASTLGTEQSHFHRTAWGLAPLRAPRPGHGQDGLQGRAQVTPAGS